MTLRKITSMTLLTSLVVLLVNSIVLYVVPEGRVAHWANWLFWGLTKEEWSDQHLTVGVLFLIAGVLHIYFNWKVIITYLRNRNRELKLFTPSLCIAALLTTGVAVGTYFRLPPMSTLVNFSGAIKENSAGKYGIPPYGRAELSSLKQFAAKESLDPEKAIILLKSAGVQLEDGDQSLKAIAAMNSISPQELYKIIKSAKIETANRPTGYFDSGGGPTVSSGSNIGLGRKTLAEVCAELDFDPAVMVSELKSKGIAANPGMTLKAIAVKGGKSPNDIHQAILTISDHR